MRTLMSGHFKESYVVTSLPLPLFMSTLINNVYPDKKRTLYNSFTRNLSVKDSLLHPGEMGISYHLFFLLETERSSCIFGTISGVCVSRR